MRVIGGEGKAPGQSPFQERFDLVTYVAGTAGFAQQISDTRLPNRQTSFLLARLEPEELLPLRINDSRKGAAKVQKTKQALQGSNFVLRSSSVLLHPQPKELAPGGRGNSHGDLAGVGDGRLNNRKEVCGELQSEPGGIGRPRQNDIGFGTNDCQFWQR